MKPRFHGHMHPRHAIRWVPCPRRSRVLDVATAFALGAALAAALFFGLSSGA